MNRISKTYLGLVVLFAATSVLLSSSTAFAHTGVGPAHDLLDGLQHPITGIDHLLAMFAVGLWAAQRGGRALWAVPLTFVSVMTFGFALGMSGFALPLVEQGIVLSVLVLGVLIAAAVRLPVGLSAMIVGAFALVHGHAHGTELPASATAMTYAVGFIMTTALLHIAGMAFGLLSQRTESFQLVRLAGAAIAACGLYIGIR